VKGRVEVRSGGQPKRSGGRKKFISGDSIIGFCRTVRNGIPTPQRWSRRKLGVVLLCELGCQLKTGERLVGLGGVWAKTPKSREKGGLKKKDCLPRSYREEFVRRQAKKTGAQGGGRKTAQRTALNEVDSWVGRLGVRERTDQLKWGVET